MHKVQFTDLGIMDYQQAWDLQRDVHASLIAAKTGMQQTQVLPRLFFVEHPHVYTLGKSGQENNMLISKEFLATIQATFYRTDRGGDITYHGPGQIVGYPVFDLEQLGLGVKSYIHNLEESIIQTLAGYGIRADRLEKATGVWLDIKEPSQTRKICAIGVRISRGVTMHGFALNVNTLLRYFSYIHPCGFTDKGVTSMEQELGAAQNIQDVKDNLLRNIAGQFNLSVSS